MIEKILDQLNLSICLLEKNKQFHMERNTFYKNMKYMVNKKVYVNQLHSIFKVVVLNFNVYIFIQALSLNKRYFEKGLYNLHLCMHNMYVENRCFSLKLCQLIKNGKYVSCSHILIKLEVLLNEFYKTERYSQNRERNIEHSSMYVHCTIQ